MQWKLAAVWDYVTIHLYIVNQRQFLKAILVRSGSRPVVLGQIPVVLDLIPEVPDWRPAALGWRLVELGCSLEPFGLKSWRDHADQLS